MSHANSRTTSGVDPLVNLDRFGLNRSRDSSAHGQCDTRDANDRARNIAKDILTAFKTFGSVTSITSSNFVESKYASNNISSAVEDIVLNSKDPIKVDESSKITVNGHSGVWANKYENLNWKPGPIPLEKYPLMNGKHFFYFYF